MMHNNRIGKTMELTAGFEATPDSCQSKVINISKTCENLISTH